MPIVDITLRRGRSNDELAGIADAVHTSIVDVFAIPPDDRFQVINQKDEDELFYDRDFLGGPRSARFIMVRIVVGIPRADATKQAVFEAISSNLAPSLEMNSEVVSVLLEHVALSDISVAGGRRLHPPHDVVPDPD
jgi:phenylpyruvate tautomerase PptA (4-oxalocrotonate tautomerase family)